MPAGIDTLGGQRFAAKAVDSAPVGAGQTWISGGDHSACQVETPLGNPHCGGFCDFGSM
ncbi:hypothetical protein ALP19_102260 [Pseudomonas syringae pv. tomato]|nr:hypothetical protein ALP19_102260 [Pseudomonas syringae pv. tomato]